MTLITKSFLHVRKLVHVPHVFKLETYILPLRKIFWLFYNLGGSRKRKKEQKRKKKNRKEKERKKEINL